MRPILVADLLGMARPNRLQINNLVIHDNFPQYGRWVIAIRYKWAIRVTNVMDKSETKGLTKVMLVEALESIDPGQPAVFGTEEAAKEGLEAYCKALNKGTFDGPSTEPVYFDLWYPFSA